jgi:hypothetical protein
MKEEINLMEKLEMWRGELKKKKGSGRMKLI